MGFDDIFTGATALALAAVAAAFGIAALALLLKYPQKKEVSLLRVEDIPAVTVAMPVPMWLREKDAQLMWTNVAYADAMGMSRRDSLGREFAERMDEAQARAMAARAARTGETQSEMRRITVKGERRRYHVYEMPVSGGRVAGWAIDVTDTHEARQELERQIAFSATVIKSLILPVAVYDANQKLILWNDAFLEMWQLDEEFARKSPRLADLAELFVARGLWPATGDSKAFRNDQDRRFAMLRERSERILHRPDGRVIRVIITPHKAGGVIFTYEDLTELYSLERERNLTLRVQRAMQDALTEAVAVFGSDGRLAYANKTFLGLWGMTEEMVANRIHYREMFPLVRPYLDRGGDWDKYQEGMQREFLTPSPHFSVFERKDGRILEARTTLLPDGAVLLSYRDLTDSKKVERALREKNEALAAADDLRSQFISAVSYELRTPLNAALGYLEMLDKGLAGDLNDRQIHYLREALAAARELRDVTDAMLDLAMVESGQVELEPQPFDLNHALKGVFEIAKRLGQDKDIQFKMDVENPSAWAYADETRMRQALLGLANAAIKSTPAGATITLGGRRAEDALEIWLHDNRDWLETPDKRSEAALALARSIARLHGGEVIVAPSQHNGLRIAMKLPQPAPS